MMRSRDSNPNSIFQELVLQRETEVTWYLEVNVGQGNGL